MNCSNIGLIQADISRKTFLRNKKKLKTHLDTCKVCQKSVLEISKINLGENIILAKKSIHSSQKIR
ncbi:hypothetical protein IGM_01970 [Bacillus cereus HuB4-4]|uniref:Zf-HC2 domain-containing protein n=1 Tax=Bacillus cereus HuB4-4 TaxID=1053211 RepID=A0A9W5QWK7_BACCE|nr:hypothetical protein IGM_01970 [Bacillus cereus HuB4-4]